VLEAARDLFEEVGYENAAIREIARRAGVSVGSVFTTFGGKADLLSEVMNDRLDSLYAELDRLAPHLRGSTADRLRSIMGLHYEFETRRLKLFVAYIGASFGCESDAFTPLGQNARLRGLVIDALRQGVSRGDVRPDADIDTFLDALLGVYVWNYRHARISSLTTAELITRMDRQIGLLFEGLAAR